MKAEVIAPPPVEERVQLEMSKQEAIVLKALVGGVGTYKGSEVREVIFDIWNALEDAGVDPDGTKTFSDLFVGDVKAL